MSRKLDTGVVLRCEGLSIGYRLKRNQTRVIANDLNLQLGKGEFVCLLGPNGAGKSTLIRALSGLEKPLAGRVEIEGEPLERLSPKDRARRISVVLTESLPLGMFDAEAIVALGRHPHTHWTGRLTDRDRERIDWSLQAVGAKPLARRLVTELSDGERQKIMVARALAQEASIMFLDEPTAYLDLPRRVELMQTLRGLAREQGMSIALSTHDLDLALRCADRLWLFGDDGSMRTGIPESLALDGSIGRAFASANLDWDPEHGSFRMHRTTCLPVWIEGSGVAKSWTRRALLRIGYGMTNEQSEAAVVVRVDALETGYRWMVEGMGSIWTCSTIEELVSRMAGDARKHGDKGMKAG